MRVCISESSREQKNCIRDVPLLSAKNIKEYYDSKSRSEFPLDLKPAESECRKVGSNLVSCGMYIVGH